jgi:hypothetical protein
MNMSEIPTHDYQCPCELCEPEAHSVRELPDLHSRYCVVETGRTRSDRPNWSKQEARALAKQAEFTRCLDTLPALGFEVEHIQDAVIITPLQRAALDNGLAFDIVDKLRAWGGLGAETLGRLLTDVQTDQALEEALSRSACAREPERSRLWWHGVLPQ